MSVLLGEPEELAAARPLRPFDGMACEFLQALSSRLLRDPEARAHPDVMAFGYWCRRAHVDRLAHQFGTGPARLGRGLAFHIAPANVPVNFAYSFAFSLLAGNANLVRVPSADFPQVRILIRLASEVLSEPRFGPLKAMTAFVRYDKDEDITARLSASCSVRIVWGGDSTIREVRRLVLPPRSVELVFPDRYSFCVLGPEQVAEAGDEALTRLAESFYNDAFLMDQNACSSPHLVVWLGGDAQLGRAQDRFWQALASVAQRRYELAPVHAVDKFTSLCRLAIERPEVQRVQRHGSWVHRLSLSALPAGLEQLRGRFGQFFEWSTADLQALASLVNERYQTLTYFGVSRERLLDFVLDNRLAGIDRIVAVGRALDIDVVWDGQEVLRLLSRVIDVR